MTVSRLYHIACGFRSAHATTVGRAYACANMGSEYVTLFNKEFAAAETLSLGSWEWRRLASTSSKSENTSVVENKESAGQLTIGEKVKQTTKDASYLGVIIAGIGITGLMFFAIFRELFSGHSPNSVYTEALKKVKKDQRIVHAVGEPIKGYGELSSRGRRRHVSHMEYIKDGVNHMRMKFYIEGSQKKGTVHLEVRENDRGSYEYRYLFVDLETNPPRTVVLEDNRLIEMNAIP